MDEQLHYCLDYEYWLRLAQGGARFGYAPYVLAASRSHAETKTERDRRALHAELNAMLKQRLGSVPTSWLVNHAYTLTELSRAEGEWRVIPFFVQMACAAVALSGQARNKQYRRGWWPISPAARWARHP